MHPARCPHAGDPTEIHALHRPTHNTNHMIPFLFRSVPPRASKELRICNRPQIARAHAEPAILCVFVCVASRAPMCMCVPPRPDPTSTRYEHVASQPEVAAQRAAHVRGHAQSTPRRCPICGEPRRTSSLRDADQAARGRFSFPR